MGDSMVYIGQAPPPNAVSEYIEYSVSVVSPTEFDPVSCNRPVLASFETLSTNAELAQKLIEASKNSVFTLVFPPVADPSEGVEITSEGGVEVVVQPDESDKVRIGQEIFTDVPERELSVGTVGYFSSYTGRSLGKDDDRRAVVVESRASSTDGGILFTTIKLDTLSLKGNEQHRQDLLTAMIAYLSSSMAAISQVKDADQTTDQSEDNNRTGELLPRDQYDIGILALYQYTTSKDSGELTSELPESALPTTLQVEFTDAEWDRFIGEVESKGVITDSGVNRQRLADEIDARQLRSLTRRLDP